MLSLAFLSCETSEIDQQEDLTIDLAKIENVINLSGDEQKVAFRLLNKESKATLWSNKMDALLESESLTDTQRKLIIEIKSYITSDLYNKNKIYPFKDKMEYLKLKAKKEFGRKKLIKFFTTIASRADGDLTIGGSVCGCSTEDSYCAWWNTCNLSGGGCEPPAGDDEGYGCGWLWEFQCNGACE